MHLINDNKCCVTDGRRNGNVIGAVGFGFDCLTGQIEHSVDEGSPPPLRFFQV